MYSQKTNDTFSLKRKAIADKCDPEIKDLTSRFFDCDLLDIIDQKGTNDYNGIDCIIKEDIYLQIKNVEYMGFNTLTIPCDDYKKYTKLTEDKELYIFHSYYDKNNKNKVRQYVILKFSDLKKVKYNGKRKRATSNVVKDGTMFYWWYYKTIKNIILDKSDNIQLESILDMDECLI